MVKTPEEIAEDNAPENQPAEDDPNFTSTHNAYVDPNTGGGRFNADGSPSGRPIQETGEVKTQTREEWSASIGDDSISVGPTDTTSNKDEDDLFYGGKGFSSRTKGANPYLKIKKKSKGAKGKFTRGSLRVKKPKRMAV